jgi:hypothetical protein
VNSSLIIYPYDSTTSFLLEPFQYLQKKLGLVKFYIVYPNDNSYDECLKLIDTYKTIVFMGHGSSNKLSGARDENYSREYLISSIEIKKLPKKNWVFFSCNSNELVKNCSSTIESGIGFGYLPTDIDEIRGIRELDSKAYLNVTEEIIDGFKQSINWIISESIIRFVEKNLTFFELFYLLRILVTRRMLDILKDPKSPSLKEQTKLLFDMKNEMAIY